MLLIPLLACSGSGPEPPARPPDVLLVVVDTLRADRVSAYGHERRTTPMLDELARNGVLFEDVTAPGSWTWPSHASLFTGEPPWVHEAHFTEKAEGVSMGWLELSVGTMRADLPTLAERFDRAGYRTVLVTENPWLGSQYGLARGFETVLDPSEAHPLQETVPALLAAEDDRPVFLFVNIFDAHQPTQAYPVPWMAKHEATLAEETAPDWLRPFLGRSAGLPEVDLLEGPDPAFHQSDEAWHRGEIEIPPEGFELLLDLYDANVQRADYDLNTVVKAWNAAGRSGVVAVTSDHGEYFGEHDLLFHCRTAYTEVLQVPLVLAGPGLEAGARVSTPVEGVELHDALLELAGLAEGSSLLAKARGGPAGPVRAVAYRDPGYAERVGGRFEHTWRYYREGSEVALVGGPTELYELATDPRMNHDLSAERPERAKALEALALALFEETAVTTRLDPDQEQLEALKALGYVGEDVTP